jgi:hypothetical protein
VLLLKGMLTLILLSHRLPANRLCRFGWVNASYVYGLNIVDTRMKRALGAITDWETYKKATAGEYMLENPTLSEEADKTVRAAVRRASIIQAGTMTPNFRAPGKTEPLQYSMHTAVQTRPVSTRAVRKRI